VKRLSHFSDRLALLVGLGLMLLPGAAGAYVVAHIVINNGLGPPNPANVIADLTYSEDGHVHARNVGCPPEGPSGKLQLPRFRGQLSAEVDFPRNAGHLGG
jgi:hypothetical protein